MKIKKAGQILVTATLCAALAFSTVSAASAPSEAPAAYADDNPAGSREEVVYANLTGSGAVKDIYTVSILTAADDGVITDYGSYTSVTNLTDTTPLALVGDQVSFNAKAGSYYYQGAVKSTALPWTIGITYSLDGKEITPEALAGQSGHVTIHLTTASNPAADASYYENYMLTISVTLDALMCRNISASGGMTANAGNDKLITFMAMPGKPSDFTVEADAVSFTMPGMEIAALPLSIKIDAPDTSAIKSDLTELTDAVRQLSDGTAQLKSGSLELKNGASDLSFGSARIAGGLGELSLNAAGLLGGSAQIKEALVKLSAALNGSAAGSSGGLDISGLAQLPDALNQTAAGLSDMTAGLAELKSAFATSYDALKAVIGQIPAQTLSQEALAELYADNPNKRDLIDTLAGYYKSGAQTKATFEAVRPAFDAVDSSLTETIAGAGQMAAALSGTAQQLKTALDGNASVTQLAQLTAGLTALSDQYAGFHDGLTSFAAGTSELSAQYGAFDAGVSGIAGGTAELYDGISQTSDGTAELSGAVKDIPDKVDEEIGKLLDTYDKSDFKPVSFVSVKNINTVSVQFVLKTAPIELPDAPAATPEEAAPENLWTRFMALFK